MAGRQRKSDSIGKWPMEQLVETRNLRIRYMPGHTKTLFVSFTGIMHELGGVSKDEFVRSSQGHHALFISDLARSWYNKEGTAETILSTVRDIQERVGAERIVTIGNSMGGFGALLFASQLGARSAIAFSPQFSLHPEIVPEENRWNKYRDRITTWRYPVVQSYADDAGYFLFFGADEEEQRHARRFEERANIGKFVLEGDHNIASLIKEKCDISSVIRDCIELPFDEAILSIEERLGSIPESGR